MARITETIAGEELAGLQAAGRMPLVIDVRRASAYGQATDVLPGAIRRTPELVGSWAGELELGRPVVVYCVHGHEVSRDTVAVLRTRGVHARYLAGGYEGWVAAGRPVAPKPAAPTVWVTRQRPKIDRIACPWLIRRFVDPDARFVYVPAAEVLEVAEKTGAVPFDIPGVRFTHEGEGCSFDTFMRHYGLDDPALDRLAGIVRGADTERPDLVPEAAGLLAISLGLSAVFAEDDQAMLRHGLVLYDALYRWVRDLQHERHSWPPVMPTPRGRA